MKPIFFKALWVAVAAGISLAANARVEGGSGFAPQYCEQASHPRHARAPWRRGGLDDAERDAWWAERRRRVESWAPQQMRFQPYEFPWGPYPAGYGVPMARAAAPDTGSGAAKGEEPASPTNRPLPVPGPMPPVYPAPRYAPMSFVPPWGAPPGGPGFPAPRQGNAPGVERNVAANKARTGDPVEGSSDVAAPIAESDAAPTETSAAEGSTMTAADDKLARVSLDSDMDGVNDYSDLCSETAAGAPVDSFGCEEAAPIVLSGVGFVTDSDQLTAESSSILDAVAETLKANPELRVSLAGYTDTDGDDVYNKDLSRRRANSVKAYLVLQGVEADNLVADGYGEAYPIASNDTPEGKATNRRVEMTQLVGE